MDNDRAYEKLIEIFRRYLAGDVELIATINHFGKSFIVTESDWQFTLPDLYAFCCAQNHIFTGLSYKQFRKKLYQNPTNQLIGKYKGNFDIVEDLGHVDNNRYKLRVVGRIVGCH